MRTRRGFLQALVRGVAGLALAPDALELLVQPERRIWPVGISLTESAYPRWRPIRMASNDFVHADVEAFFRNIRDQGTPRAGRWAVSERTGRVYLQRRAA